MEEIANPLKNYLTKIQESPYEFACRAYISPSTVYKIFKGSKPRKNLAAKICRNSKGELNLRDFGYE